MDRLLGFKKVTGGGLDSLAKVMFDISPTVGTVLWARIDCLDH